MTNNTVPSSQPVPPAPYTNGGLGQAIIGYPSQKSFITTWLLSLFLGGLGVDRFYLGKIGTGILKLVTGGAFGIWSLVDLILVLAGKQTDKNGQPLAGYNQHKVKAVIVTVAVIVVSWIIGIATMVSAASGASKAVSAIASSASTLPAAPSAAAPASSAAQAAAAAPAAQPAVTTPAGTGQTPLASKTYTGTGDDVVSVNLGGQPAIVSFDCAACSSNTVLKTNGADSLLVNTIGAYSGSHLVDTSSGSATTQLEINADSAWKITISDPTTAQKAAGPVSGHGDSVLFLSGNTTKATITNNGQNNFVVTGYGDSFPQLAVNTIGSYSGTVILTGPGFVQVESDGDWTLNPQ